MSLSGKQKKYLKRNLERFGLEKVAADLGIQPKEIDNYLTKIWGREKYLRKANRETDQPIKQLQEKISSFNFGHWLAQNQIAIGILILLVVVCYANSIGNEFVSDDVAGIVKNPELGKVRHIFANPTGLVRPVLFFLIDRIFGRKPPFFRLINIFFHLASTLSVYLLAYLLNNATVGFLAALLVAVHPIMIESVTWISGGPYSISSFFIITSLIFYLLASKNKNSKLNALSVVSLVLALLSSEKTMVFPAMLFLFVFAFRDIKKDWKKIIIPSIICLIWIGIYANKIPGRITELRTNYYEKVQTANPFYQVPIALSSYLELMFWPDKLTLYHSEMFFSKIQYSLKLLVTITLLMIIALSYKKNRQIFFWLSLFIISLLPTLTPLGVSWIVAERYVYLGAIGIFVTIAIIVDRLNQATKIRNIPLIIFSLVIIALVARTVIRNKDWQSEDSLWLAADRTSPNSAQNHNNLGDYYSRHGNFEKAAEEFKRATELKPGYADAFHNLGNVYLSTKKIDQAIESYQTALKFNSNIWQSYQNLSYIYFEQKNYQSAKENLEKAIVINPANAPLRTNLGMIYLYLGEKEKARQELEIALQLDPENEKAHQLLNEAL